MIQNIRSGRRLGRRAARAVQDLAVEQLVDAAGKRQRGDAGQFDRGLRAARLEEAGELAQRGVAPGQRFRSGGENLDDREASLVGVLGQVLQQRPQPAATRSAQGAPGRDSKPLAVSRAGCRAARRRWRGSSPPCCRRVRRRSCGRRRRRRSRRPPGSPDSRARRRPRSSPGGCGCAGTRSPPLAKGRAFPAAAARSDPLRVCWKPLQDCRGDPVVPKGLILLPMGVAAGKWTLAPAAVAAALLAAGIGLGACGGDDATTSPADPPAQSTAAQGANEETAGSEGKPSQASSQFGTPGGDNSVQSSGEEASAAELKAASAVVLAFMRASAAGNRAQQCVYLSAETIALIKELGHPNAEESRGLRQGPWPAQRPSSRPRPRRHSERAGRQLSRRGRAGLRPLPRYGRQPRLHDAAAEGRRRVEDRLDRAAGSSLSCAGA